MHNYERLIDLARNAGVLDTGSGVRWIDIHHEPTCALYGGADSYCDCDCKVFVDLPTGLVSLNEDGTVAPKPEIGRD